jgi:hypothetical protein
MNKTPPYISDDFQIGPDGAFEYIEDDIVRNRGNKNMSNKEDKILREIYKRAYAAATPPADFDILIANATLDEYNRKVIPYNDYELEDGIAQQIIDDVMKEFKVAKWKRQLFNNTYWLGCSPKSKQDDLSDWNVTLNDGISIIN